MTCFCYKPGCHECQTRLAKNEEQEFRVATDSELWKKNTITGVSGDKAKIDDPAVDMINAPPHYVITVNGIEIDCIDVIRALGLFENYPRASAFKYLWRADKKGDRLKDLQKAKRFIELEIAEVEAKNATVRKDGK